MLLHVPWYSTGEAEDLEQYLPTLDPGSLATYFYLQLTQPRQYQIHVVKDITSTPLGQFPFLITGRLEECENSMTTFERIISSLGAQLDTDLTEEEHAQSVSWKALVKTKLGDLVTYTYFGNALNFNEYTHPLLVHGLPLPQKYFIPKRVRELYKRRLESEGLWEEGVHSREKERTWMKKKSLEEIRDENVQAGKKTIKKAFTVEKIQEKARAYFSLFIRVLERNNERFLFGHLPTSVDLLLAAHILVLLPMYTKVPENEIGLILQNEFKRLVELAEMTENFCRENHPPRFEFCKCDH